MAADLTYFAKVDENGVIQGLARKKFAREVKDMFSGKSIEITVRRKKKHRSVQQNRYYWLVVTMLSDYTGFTKDEMHAILRSKFLRAEKVNEDTGVVYEYVKSTTELTTVEYEEYLDDVRRFAAQEFNMNVPMPNEQIEVF
ncbi:MAG TPA: hypothetical protein PKC38_04260 [Chitinophagales bacterium]|nr:hypothetical protein [Chitinophagales bacterium]HNH32165.1 hypothetical protein [bacterium]